MDRTKCVISAAAFVAAFSSGGQAQTGDLRSELAHCLSFGGAVERLSCYDRLARQAGGAAPQERQPPAPIPQSRGELPAGSQSFGKEELRTAPVPGEDRLTAEISDFRKDQAGRFTVALSNGQVWQQVAGDTTAAQYRPGKTHSVTISRGSLGSYDLKFNDRNATFKVRRFR